MIITKSDYYRHLSFMAFAARAVMNSFSHVYMPERTFEGLSPILND